MAYTKQQIIDGMITPALMANIGADTTYITVSEPLVITDPVLSMGYDYSSFSGTGWNIGAPKDFGKITFKIRARANLSLIKTVIKIGNKSGAIVVSKDIPVSIASGTTALVSVIYDTNIANSAGDNLYFMFASDGLTSTWVANNSNSPFPYPAYPTSTYTTGGSQNFSIFTDVVSPSVASLFAYVKIEKAIVSGITPSTTFSYLVAKASPIIKNRGVTIDIVLPSMIFAIEGRETNIYFQDIVYSNVRVAQLDFDITCTKGFQNEKFWRVNPVSTDVGSYSFTLDVYFNNLKIATATATIYIVSANSSSGVSRKVIGVGDSTLSAGQPLSTLITEHSADVMTVAFNGTQGSGSNKHEGRSGWTISDFSTVGRTFYKYTVSGVTTAPGIGSVYSDGTNQFTVKEINITSGSGYFSFERTLGTGTSSASGSLSKIAGTGDVAISYSAWSTTPGNPFWVSGSLNFGAYLTNNSITLSSSDWVFIHLGINDVTNYTDDLLLASQINTMITQLRTLITNMRSGISGLRVAICITIMPTISQDGFGANYGNGQTLYRHLINIKAWQKRLITEFDNATERTAGNYLIAWNSIVDRENNMQKANVNANARNTTQINTYTNGVHPAQSGYDQMGDQLWAFLKYMA